MVKYSKSCFQFISVFIFLIINTSSFSQTLTSEADYDISPNNYVTGIHRNGVVEVHNPSGRVVYLYHEADGVGLITKDVYCVIYNPDMTVLVSAFRVNTTTTDDQFYGIVKVNQYDNTFAVILASKHSGNYDVYMKKYDLDGVQLVGETAVSAAYTGHQYLPKAAFDYSRNEIVVLFRDDAGQDGGGAGSTGCFIQRFNYANLGAIGSQFQVNQTITSQQGPSAIEISQASKQLIVIYHSNHVSANLYDIYKTVFNYNNSTSLYDSPVETRVNNYTSNDQTWASILINQTTGDYVIAWTSWGGQDGSGSGSYAKIYNSNHAIIKDEFLVSNVTTDNQHSPRPLWDETVNHIIFFHYFSVSGTSTLKYRIFDGLTNAGQYNAVGGEADAIGGLNTTNYYTGAFIPVYYNSLLRKVYLCYDVYNNFSNDSKLKARKYGFTHPSFVTSTPTDNQRNWVQKVTYDETGTSISEVRVYTDNLGRTKQTQEKNISDVSPAQNKIVAQAVVYDKFGRPALSTLPGVVNSATNFGYDQSFIANSSLYGTSPNQYYAPYTWSDFDGIITSQNPVPVTNNSSLGKYYSNNNTLEAYVAGSSYPYL